MQEYKITADSGMETTVLLSDEDAKARGLKPSDAEKSTESKAKRPANKQAPDPQNKGAAAQKANG